LVMDWDIFSCLMYMKMIILQPIVNDQLTK
jgi:hypothetical protein